MDWNEHSVVYCLRKEGRKGNGGRGREDGEKRGRCCRLLDPFITSAENLSDFSLSHTEMKKFQRFKQQGLEIMGR